MNSDDDMENWDEEFGITPNASLSLTLAAAAPTNQDNGANTRGNLFGMDEVDGFSDEEWTGDINSAPAPQKILGIKADPNAKEEDWGSDFEFANDNSEDDKSLLSPVRNVLLNRTRSASQIQPNQHTINLAEELLASIPSEDEFILLYTAPTAIKDEGEVVEIDWNAKIEQHNEKIVLLKNDKFLASREYWELGLMYQSYSKVVPAMAEFQHALQMLEECNHTDNSPPDAYKKEFELSLLYHMGLAAKDMADIFQQTEYFEKALKIAQTDKKYLPQLTHINLELGLSLLLSENPLVALRYLEAHLRSLLYAHCPSTELSHVHINSCINTDLVDWRAICSGCLSVGKAVKALDQNEIAIGYFEKAQWLGVELKDKEIEQAARSFIEVLSSKTNVKESKAPKKHNLGGQTTPRAEEEDWDAELGIESEHEDRPVLRLPGQLPTVGTPRSERVPLRYRLLESVSNQTFEIVKFPKPTFLYTLTTTSGHVFMHEEELEQWLKNVLSRHVKSGTPALHAKEKVPLAELRNFYATAMATVVKGSKRWAILCVEFCYIIYLHGHLELCWDSIHGFFRDLQDVMPPVTQERDVLFDFSFHLLYLAAKLWRPEEDEAYQFMIKVQQQLNPPYSHLVDVLVAETYSHHLHHKHGPKGHNVGGDSDSDGDDSDSEGEVVVSKGVVTPKTGGKSSVDGELDEAKANPLIMLCRVFAHCKNQPALAHDAGMTKSKSMSVGRLAETLHPKCVLARALVAIHLHLNGFSPLTTARTGGVQESFSGNRSLKMVGGVKYEQVVHQPAERLRILTELYPSIPISHLKAKIAFVMADYATTACDNYPLAEKLYFEAIYILDMCRPVVDGLPTILSELGASVLLGYAEVLLHNFKYQYAILCFEATMANMHLRGKEKEYQGLLQRVAATCRENDDLKRCVILYRDILHSCCADNKINEVIYVSETLASLHQERGEFSLAEGYLLAASLALRKNSPQTDRMDPLYFQLQLKLAYLYLESFNFERGIELLERLNRGDMPHSKRSMLLADLAKAYIKKEWTDECSSMLSRIENEEKQGVHLHKGYGGQIAAGARGGGSFGNNTPTSTRSDHGSTGGSGGGGDLGKHLKYWHLLTLNNYHASRFPEAIASIECALELCPHSGLKNRGQFFYLRGKVFQALCSSASSSVVNFPTNLRPTDEWKEAVHYPASVDTSTSVNYTCTGDFVQECVASYKKAYQYFKSIGDDLQIAKTVCRIAESYLGRVFAPVALLHYPYDDIARSPIFHLSHVITKDKTGSTDAGDQEDSKRKDDAKKTTTSLRRSKSDNVLDKEFSITLERIENPTKLAMDICADTCDLTLMMRSYMNMAELRFLQNDLESALAFWAECKYQFFSLFFSGPQLLAAGPPHVLKRMYRLAERMTRFLFCFDNSELINSNLKLVDIYLHLQIETEVALKRPIQSSKSEHEYLDSISSHPSIRQIVDIFLPLMGGPFPPISASSSSPSSGFPVAHPGAPSHQLSRGKLGASLSIPLSTVPNRNPPNPSNGSSSLPSLTTVVRKARSHPKRATAGHLFDIPDEMGETTADISRSNLPSLDSSGSLFLPNNDETALNNTMIAERVWGNLHAVKFQLRKYGAGKITQEELQARNQQTIKKILKLVSHKKLPTATSSVNLLSPGNAQASTAQGDSTTTDIYDTAPFNTSSSFFNTHNTRKELTRLVYVLQVDHYVIYYAPKTGKKVVSRLGGNEELNPQVPPGHPVFLQVHLLANPDEVVTLMVNPFFTLERILSFLCFKQYWIQPEGAAKRKTPFFGSFSRGSGSSLKSHPRFVDRTNNFHQNLTKLLSILGFNVDSNGNGQLHSSSRDDDSASVSSNDSDGGSSPPTTPTSITPPTTLSGASGQTIYDQFKRAEPPAASSANPNAAAAALKSLSFAKKIARGYDPSFSRAFVPLGDQMECPLYKLFSRREMRDCGEQSPVHLYLYLSAGADTLLASQSQSQSQSHTHANQNSQPIPTPSFISSHRPASPLLGPQIRKTATTDQAVSLTQDMINLLASQLSLHATSKESQEDTDLSRKIVSDLQHIIAAPLKEIAPPPEEYDEEAPTSKLPASKSRSMFHVFSSGKVTDQKNVKPVTGVPLTLVCSHTFHIFPWELMFGEAIVRHLSLWDALSSVSVPRSKGPLPLFVGVFYSQGERTIAQLDTVRKDTIIRRVLHGLRVTGPVSLHRGCCTPYPFHTPLIKYGRKSAPYKRKYKYADFLDLSDPLADVSKFVEGVGNNFYPVFLLTYADLLDASQMVLHLLRTNKCTALFIPGGKLKSVTSKLMKLQDNYIKQNSKHLQTLGPKDRYQYIMSVINYLEEEHVTPISIFNSPIV